MPEYEFFVPGRPQGKSRPRFARKSGIVYTPTATRQYEQYIQKCFLGTSRESPEKVMPPILIQIDAIKVPKRKSDKWWGSRPDADNILKVVCDALNGIAYTDDADIVEARVRKICGPVAGLNIRISTITWDPLTTINKQVGETIVRTKAGRESAPLPF